MTMMICRCSRSSQTKSNETRGGGPKPSPHQTQNLISNMANKNTKSSRLRGFASSKDRSEGNKDSMFSGAAVVSEFSQKDKNPGPTNKRKSARDFSKKSSR